MNVRMKLEVSAEGMATRNDGGNEMSFFRPGKYRLGRSPEKAVKQESIFIEELSKF